MNKSALLLGLGAGLLMAAGTAQAGVCSGEIMALQKKMENLPTMASTSNATPEAGVTASDSAGTKAHAVGGAAPLPPVDAEVPDPGATLGAPPSGDAAGGETANAVPSGSGEAAGSPGTIEQPDASGGTLVQGGRAAATGAPVDEGAPADAATAAATTGRDPDAAAQALARARAFDQAGDEAACMNAINEAKSKLGQQ
jgi:hypothetical protein